MRSLWHPQSTTALLSSLLLLTPSPASAFYLPGVAPTSYKAQDPVPLYVNSLTPVDSGEDTKLKSVFSFDYYHGAFHYCIPKEGVQDISESLGSIIFGDRIKTSPYNIRMLVDEECKSTCMPQVFKPHDAQFVNQRIWQGYNLNWLVDGLPAAQELIDIDANTTFYSPGFALGYIYSEEAGGPERPVFNNHFDISIDYHQAGRESYRVVGVLVEPRSLRDSKNTQAGAKAQCGDPSVPLELSEEHDTTVTFTYSVRWNESPTPFATRWDKYLHVYNPRVHWLPLGLSALIVAFFSAMVATVLTRALHKDIARYNRLDQFALDDLSGTSAVDEGVQEDSGWKLVHGDVFRTPKNPLFLSVLLGNGAQLFMMAGFTIAFAMFGFLSPSNRGALGTIMILLYTFFGSIGGYVSARMYKSFGGTKWKQNFAFTPSALPALVFATFFLLNLFVWARQAAGAVPFLTMTVLALLWFVISVPLSLAGSWAGFRHATLEAPVRTNQIPRQIPPTPTGWMRPLPSMLAAGLLPFGAIFVELYFILNSLWMGKVYYMFGFLFLCYGLMVMTCAAVTVLLMYFVLCAEDYHWQWRSFLTAGACALYVFLAALVYWVRVLSFTSWTSGVLYLGYSALISGLVFVLTGSVGFFASWLFVMKIYRSIKVD